MPIFKFLNTSNVGEVALAVSLLGELSTPFKVVGSIDVADFSMSGALRYAHALRDGEFSASCFLEGANIPYTMSGEIPAIVDVFGKQLNPYELRHGDFDIFKYDYSPGLYGDGFVNAICHGQLFCDPISVNGMSPGRGSLRVFMYAIDGKIVSPGVCSGTIEPSIRVGGRSCAVGAIQIGGVVTLLGNASCLDSVVGGIELLRKIALSGHVEHEFVPIAPETGIGSGAVKVKIAMLGRCQSVTVERFSGLVAGAFSAGVLLFGFDDGGLPSEDDAILKYEERRRKI